MEFLLDTGLELIIVQVIGVASVQSTARIAIAFPCSEFIFGLRGTQFIHLFVLLDGLEAEFLELKANVGLHDEVQMGIQRALGALLRIITVFRCPYFSPQGETSWKPQV